MRARRPCCIPRSKRSIATLGDGCSCGVSAADSHPNKIAATHDLDLHSDFAHEEPREKDEDGHADDEPELLRAEQATTGRVPLARVRVVRVPEHDKHPGEREADPARGSACGEVTAWSGAHQPTKRWYRSNVLHGVRGERARGRWQTHLWWVFRTQGKAERMETMTAMLVRTPITSTASWFTSWLTKISTTL